MGIYEERVLPRIIDLVLGGAPFTELRRRVVAGLEGEVLEVGFGSGRNVALYPPEIKRVQAVDPALAGRKIAAKRLADSKVPVEYIGLDGQNLPLDDDVIDHVLVTWTLCTIPDVDAALSEMRRVLRPGGKIHFVEHGLAPQPQVARWQDRLTPLQRRLGGGCHLNRPIEQMIEEAGFRIEEIDKFYAKGPKPFGYMYRGVGISPD